MTIGEQRAKAILHRHDIMTFGLNCSIYSVADAISKLEDQLQAAQQRIEFLNSENLSLHQRTFLLEQRIRELEAQHIEPDWTQAPVWAQWFAVDKNGDAYWYAERPHLQRKLGQWHTPEDKLYLWICDDFLHNLWTSSLRKRPQQGEEEV